MPAWQASDLLTTRGTTHQIVPLFPVIIHYMVVFCDQTARHLLVNRNRLSLCSTFYAEENNNYHVLGFNSSKKHVGDFCVNIYIPLSPKYRCLLCGI